MNIQRIFQQPFTTSHLTRRAPARATGASASQTPLLTTAAAQDNSAPSPPSRPPRRWGSFWRTCWQRCSAFVQACLRYVGLLPFVVEIDRAKTAAAVANVTPDEQNQLQACLISAQPLTESCLKDLHRSAYSIDCQPNPLVLPRASVGYAGKPPPTHPDAPTLTDQVVAALQQVCMQHQGVGSLDTKLWITAISHEMHQKLPGMLYTNCHILGHPYMVRLGPEAALSTTPAAPWRYTVKSDGTGQGVLVTWQQPQRQLTAWLHKPTATVDLTAHPYQASITLHVPKPRRGATLQPATLLSCDVQARFYQRGLWLKPV